MSQKTAIKKLLQSAANVYSKMRQVLKSTSGITKCEKRLLQRELGIIKRVRHYKV